MNGVSKLRSRRLSFWKLTSLEKMKLIQMVSKLLVTHLGVHANSWGPFYVVQRTFSTNSPREHSFSKLWLQGKGISLSRQIQVYEAQVVSVFLYGSCSWAAPKHVLERLNTTQRRYLWCILNITWPYKISNKNVYNRCYVYNRYIII